MQVRPPLKAAPKSRVFQSKHAWHEIGDRRIFFRSNWEKKYAEYLEFLKQKKIISEWQHEPQTFWFQAIKRGTTSYLPDFKVTRTDGSTYWVEVKGYWDRKSLTKVKRFRKYYPQEELITVEKNFFKK